MRSSAAVLLIALLLPAAIHAAGSHPSDTFDVPSPDGRFVFRQTVQWNSEDGEAAFTIIDAQTKRSVLIDPAASLPPMEDSITCLWAPDSKRFAINARVAGRYDTELFEWAGKDFHHIAVEQLITTLIAAARKQEFKKAPIPPGNTVLHRWETQKAVKWQGPDTLEVLASSTRSYAPNRAPAKTTHLTSSFSFTLKLQKNSPPSIIGQSALSPENDRH